MSVLALARVDRLAGLALLGVSEVDWYERAGSALSSLALARGWDPGRLADVVAVVSPRVSVAENLRIAVRYMAGGWGALGRKLLPCVAGALREYEISGRIGGSKCRAFAAALRGDASAVVVDVWVCRALAPMGHTGAAIYRRVSDGIGAYGEAAARVRAVARELGWAPASAQAALWAWAVRSIGRRSVIPCFDTSSLAGV